MRHSLRFGLSGGAPLPSHVAERLERALAVPVLQGYGLTETGTIAQSPLPPHSAPARSVGLPSNVDIVIVDETGREAAVGETGEVLVRGPEEFAATLKSEIERFRLLIKETGVRIEIQ